MNRNVEAETPLVPPPKALAAELAGGPHTGEEIAALLAPLLPNESRESITAEFAEGEPARWLSARELHELADKLAHENRFDLAIEVQEKAAERAPGEAEHWNQLGWLRQVNGQREQAVEAYERYLELNPEDAYMRHRLHALKGGTAPARASDESMVREFDGFSEHYDEKMRQALRYEAPERLVEKLWGAMGSANGLDILDIGCGTGLVGAGLKPRTAFLAGIDLSPGMIEKARERGIYDLLEESEITAWLENQDAASRFDAITACDCLVYFGDLSRVAHGAAKRLKPGGWFAFTIERGEEDPFKLMDSGRYKHHENHVRAVATAAGLTVQSMEEGFLRYEGGEPVVGLYTVLHKPVA